MKNVEFVTMSGIDVVICADLLSAEWVTKKAAEHYGTEVICVPGVFGTGTVCAGWKIMKKSGMEVVGYMLLATGWFAEPSDFEYGVNLFIPFCSQWSFICGYKVRYISKELQIVKR